MIETSITVKIIAGLLALLVVIRLLGKKELSQITPFDFVYILILGGLLSEAVYDDLVTVWDVLYTITLWAVLIYIIEKVIQYYDKLRPIVKGEPVIIIDDGELNLKAIKKNDLEMEQLRSMLRGEGIFSIKEVKFAILENNGQLSVMKKENESPVTPEMLSIEPKEAAFSHLIIDEGEIESKTLKTIEKDETWLRNELSKLGYDDITKIYYAEWSQSDGFIIR